MLRTGQKTKVGSASDEVSVLGIHIETREDFPKNAIGLEQGGKLAGGIVNLSLTTQEACDMTTEGYRQMLLQAMRRQSEGDSKLFDLIAEVLEEQDRAKQILRDKGYGCTGMGIAETAGEVPSAL